MLKDVILLCAGLVVGVINALAGGGMLVGFPALLGFGLTPIMANGTGNIITSPSQLASAIGYWKSLRRVPLRFALLIVPCLLGGVAGALVLRYTPARDFSLLAPWLILFGVGLFALQPLIPLPKRQTGQDYKPSLCAVLLLSLALLPVAFYGGYFGAGFGFMMLALLGFTPLEDTHAMNAMKNLAATIISLVSLLCLLGSNLLNWHAGFVMCAGSVIGGYFGARTALHIPSRGLRIVIVCFGLAATAYLFLHPY